MSRPEELPRAASPMKRRAGSAPSEDTLDAAVDAVVDAAEASDVEMHTLPPAANSEDVSGLDGDTNQSLVNTSHASQDGIMDDIFVDNDAGDNLSTIAQRDDGDEDQLDLVGLNMDSAYEPPPAFDNEDIAPAADNPGGIGDEAQELAPNQEMTREQDAGSSKDQANESSTPNTDEAVDSDSKTADTAGTSTSVEEPVKSTSLLLGPKYDFGANNYKGSNNQSGRSSPAPPPYSTRGRARKEDRRGLVGLSNLGNTCYMNSALQCIRAVEELTKYFLSGEFVDEVNYENFMGHNGEVANAYAQLLNSIYKKSSGQSSVSPRQFKDVVGRHAHQFAGWAQQDTQEFLGFLLDSLQEDLSRVKPRKPYIEKPDSTDEMVGNQELIRKMAAEVWSIHKRRDDSVIGDLFTGLYKSTLVCPTCDKVSITFEPFNNLTLPLPIRNVYARKVRYFPLNDRPVDVMIELDKSMTIKGLKNFISSRVGVPADRIIGAEEYKERFFKIYEDNQQAWDEIDQPGDHPCFYELEAKPTNVGVKKKVTSYRSTGYFGSDNSIKPYEEDPDFEGCSDNLVVPVMHRFNPRFNQGSRAHYARSTDKVGPPHFIILTPAEARNEEAIRRKILEKVLTFTSHPEIRNLATVTEDQSTDDSHLDPALNPTDADMSGCSRVVAKSIEGEDDLVDVRMQDATQDRPANQDANEYPHLLKKFNTKRPDWIDPAVFLDGQLQSMFDMSFFSDNTPVASGWTSYNNDKLFPRLATRKPQTAMSSDEEMPSPSGSGTASDESSSDEAPEPIVPLLSDPVTRMESESSDEESLPDVTNLPLRSAPEKQKLRGGRKGKPKKASKVYGKKNRSNKFQKQQKAKDRYSPNVKAGGGGGFSFQSDDPEEGSKADGGPLIRLGEGIVVEWDQSAWNSVFGLHPDSTNEPESAPYSTFTKHKVETLHDSILEAQQIARRARSKQTISLYNCLDEFEKEEILSEEDKWYCPRCKEFCRASKKFDLWHTPDILIVHLKRFSSSGTRRDKIDALVECPIEGLDISTRVLEKTDGKQEVYDLIAIDDHMGGLGGGHYTAFAKNFQDGNWYKFDDTQVSNPISNTKNMISGHAYLLFYRRRSDRPLGGPMLEEACRKYAADNEPEVEEEAAQNSEGTESR